MDAANAARSLALLVLASACTHPARPTITGAELYEQVHALQTTGRATVRSVSVTTHQVLATDSQSFAVAQVIDRCKGGDPSADVDCALTLLLDQRFAVLDNAPAPRTSSGSRTDRSGSMLTAAVVIGLAVGVTGGLVYGVAACDFPGCKYVFGVPLVFIGGAALFALGRD